MRPINRRFFVKLDGTNGAYSVIALPDSQRAVSGDLTGSRREGGMYEISV
jgi:hypothetical protein